MTCSIQLGMNSQRLDLLVLLEFIFESLAKLSNSLLRKNQPRKSIAASIYTLYKMCPYTFKCA